MSARLSILMVKNSPSFELTKIRHYHDKPYRALYEKAKGSPPTLPKLQAWQDEALGGAISPAAGETVDVTGGLPEGTVTATRKAATKRTPTPRGSKAGTDRRRAAPPSTSTAPLVLTPARPAEPVPVRKTLTLGAAPAPAGESCDLRDILASAGEGQGEAFDAMMDVLESDQTLGVAVTEAKKTLEALHRSFGDDDK